MDKISKSEPSFPTKGTKKTKPAELKKDVQKTRFSFKAFLSNIQKSSRKAAQNLKPNDITPPPTTEDFSRVLLKSNKQRHDNLSLTGRATRVKT